MKRAELIEILARWKPDAHGSVPVEEHRTALRACRTSELQEMYDQVAGKTGSLQAVLEYPDSLNTITDVVLAYRPKRKP